jgi:predicted small secreted protein
MKSQLLRTMLLASLLALMGCNTVEGVGQDIEVGGEKMQTKAKEVKRDM